MHLLGKNSRTRKQNAGNICLLVFLVFLATTVILPVGAQDAFAKPPSPSLETLRSEVAVDNDQVRIYMLLTPTTDEHFESIFVDFTQALGETQVLEVVYEQVYDSVYGEIYGYAVNLVYDIPEGATVQYHNKPVFVRDEDDKLIMTELVNLEVKPPRKSNAEFTIIPRQKTFPVGNTVLMDIHLDNENEVEGADFVLLYDPDYLQVVDGVESEEGIQIIPGTSLPHESLTINKVEDGKITFAVAGKLDESLNLATVKFKILQAGTSTLTFKEANVAEETHDGIEELAAAYHNLSVTGVSTSRIDGKVKLDAGWHDDDFSGATVSAAGTDYSAETDDAGLYSLNVVGGTFDLWATYPKHLKARQRVTVVPGQNLNDVNFSLISGDANNDNRVSLADLVILAGEYPKNSTGVYSSDFNGDGKVTLTDLVILAKNYLAVGDS